MDRNLTQVWGPGASLTLGRVAALAWPGTPPGAEARFLCHASAGGGASGCSAASYSLSGTSGTSWSPGPHVPPVALPGRPGLLLLDVQTDVSSELNGLRTPETWVRLRLKHPTVKVQVKSQHVRPRNPQRRKGGTTVPTTGQEALTLLLRIFCTGSESSNTTKPKFGSFPPLLILSSRTVPYSGQEDRDTIDLLHK